VLKAGLHLQVVFGAEANAGNPFRAFYDAQCDTGLGPFSRCRSRSEWNGPLRSFDVYHPA